MGPTKNVTFRDAITRFSSLSVPEQREILLEFQSIHEGALNQRRRELLDELNALAPRSATGQTGRNAPLQAVRYRSKRDPLLVWSGRGRMARWLVEEMKETGLPREAFRVK